MAAGQKKIVEPFLEIGAAAERGLAYVGGLTQLLGQAFAHVFRSPLKRSLSFERASHQAICDFQTTRVVLLPCARYSFF